MSNLEDHKYQKSEIPGVLGCKVCGLPPSRHPRSTASLLDQLRFAARSCLCESYYRYKCGKCRDLAEGEAPRVKEAEDLGLVTYLGYGAPRLTDAGRAKLRELDGK